MRLDLEGRGRSEATIGLYLSVAERFERFVAAREPPVDLELSSCSKLVRLVEEWADDQLPTASAPTRRSYRSAFASYLRVLDPAIESSDIELCRGNDDLNVSLAWAGRRRPSMPLTDRQLKRFRERAPADAQTAWKRTAVELALAGLSWQELQEARRHQFSPYGNEAEIRLLGRTVPIVDTITKRWLWSCSEEHFPSGVGEKGVSLRSVQRAVSGLVSDSRSAEYGQGQGLRALHNTGATRAIRRGISPERTAKIYGRSHIPKQWRSLVPERAALGRLELDEPPVPRDPGTPGRAARYVEMTLEEFDEQVLHLEPGELED